MCTQTPGDAAKRWAEVMAAGGADAQGALGACELADPKCANGTRVTCSPVWAAFWKMPELMSSSTIMRWAGSSAGLNFRRAPCSSDACAGAGTPKTAELPRIRPHSCMFPSYQCACRYVPNIVAAYDAIGIGACITVVVKEPKPSTLVVFQEQVHTQKVVSAGAQGAA